MPTINGIVSEISDGELSLVEQAEPWCHSNGHGLGPHGLRFQSWVAMPLERHPDIVPAFKKPLKQDVACNLEKCEDDVWLFCALQHK